MFSAMIVDGGLAYRHGLTRSVIRKQVCAANNVAHHRIFVTKMLNGREIKGVWEAGWVFRSSSARYFIYEIDQALVFGVEPVMTDGIRLTPTEKRLTHGMPPQLGGHQGWKPRNIP